MIARVTAGIIVALVAFLFAGYAVRAQQHPIPELGDAIFCDTQEQIEHVAAMWDELDTNAELVSEVNAYFGDEHACGLRFIAFFPGQAARTVHTRDMTVEILPILLVAWEDDEGVMHNVKPVRQWALHVVERDGA